MKRLGLLILTAAVLTAAVSGCHTPNRAERPTPSGITAPPTPPGKVVAYVINPKALGDKDLLMPHAIAGTPSKQPAKDAVQALLNSAHSPLVPGTALRGISVDSGTATVDFSQSPVSDTGGEDAQSAGLNALAMTLGQFPEIAKFQIEVKGQVVKSFGEFTTDGPMDVIRPADKSVAEGSGR